MRELISATTTSAHSAAARVASALAPSVQKPCSSGSQREVQKTHVHVVAAITHERGNLAEENGNLVVKNRRQWYVVILSPVHSLAGVSADKQITRVEDAVELCPVTAI